MAAYYNEFDPYAAEWLRNLIKNGLIADGDVDERSILDVVAADLRGYTQCHFFAGIGVWSHALRLAGWPDDQPVWTGSCPCQPFSAAGKGKGFDDERHLWPVFHRLIAECRPAVVFGEQVASKDGLQWLDAVCADMEASGYAIGAADLCAAGVGAPHIRQRLWFVAEALADTSGSRQPGQGWGGSAQRQRASECGVQGGLGELSGLADAMRGGTGNDTGEGVGAEAAAHCKDGGVPGERLRSGIEGSFCGLANADKQQFDRSGNAGQAGRREFADIGATGGLEHASSVGWERRQAPAPGHDDDGSAPGGTEGQHGVGLASSHRLHQDGARPTNGHWRDADWLHCRDGKWRPVEARPQPLADGSAESLGRVRPEVGEEIERAIDAAAVESKVSRSSLLRALRESLGAQARSVWEAGRLPGLHEAPFLLAFLRQLQTEGWAVEEGIALPSEEEQARVMRMLRGNEQAAGASHRRELEEQRSEQPADALHLLPSLLARHAQAAWGHAYETYAEIGFPIGHGSPARVGRLRAYGNAIVPQVAAEVIGAYLET